MLPRKDNDDLIIPWPASAAGQGMSIEPIRIRAESFQWQFARSGGPGGQNVNKVATKAQLRWNPRSIELPADIFHRLLRLASTYLTAEGDILLTSQRYRSQRMNMDDCLDKLKALLQASLIRPRQRRATRPTRGSKERRLKTKRHESNRRADRRISGSE